MYSCWRARRTRIFMSTMSYVFTLGLSLLVAFLCLITAVDGNIIETANNDVALVIDVYTGDHLYAGTGANVYIDLHGKDGNTGSLLLDSSGNLFKRGNHDRFSRTVHNFGTPTYLKIWHDGNGHGSGWFLDRVEVDISGKSYTFNYNEWIEKQDPKYLYTQRCGSPPSAPSGGHWTSWESSPYVVHQTELLECYSGYVRSRSDSLSTITCLSSGYWSSTRATCSVIPPVNGGWGTWQSWGTCSVSCAGGVNYRYRTCNNPRPQHGGSNCYGSSSDSNQCAVADCPKWSSWFYNPCSATCGNGTKHGVRTCSSGHVEDCLGFSTTTAACNIAPCPVDGGWGSWAVWGSCSLTCENGTRSRGRLCDSPAPAHGGIGCHGNSTNDGVCNSQDCPHWGPYSKTGVCSVTCGQGVEQLTRNCSTGNAKDCPGSRYDESPCSKPACLTIVVG